MVQNFTATLSNKIELAPSIWKFTFKLTNSTVLNFKAGQYLILKIGEKRRLYSVLSPDYIKDSFDLLVEIFPFGVGSTYLNNLSIGDHADFQGPAGLFIIKDERKPKIFLATGTGFAPIYSEINTFLSSEPGNEVPLFLFWGLKTAQNIYLEKELNLLAQEHGNFKYYICLSRETDERVFENTHVKRGRMNDVMMAYFEAKDTDLSNDYEYYVCGGREVVEQTHQFLLNKNIEKENIVMEKF
jgi:NAD(P)H-flavin reductase